ncbi:DUF4143 domain-containing protein [uncultured Proteiniphilum sp.]|uniref:DUF4143 domain-containing protein n=1 Tax=uncultured Proteiniphilum sp. TaxID=497637 RepID=UPI0026247924|nr:DUF4143 domain-containing protein [uncultured Proteiniphilum sp.]
MPATVKEFINTNSFVAVADIQNRILNEYIADMAKYAEPSTSSKIRACYESIPAQLAKENRKFQYSVVQKGGSATIFGESIEWLRYAGIVLKCQKTTQGTMPIKVHVDLSDFKLYMSDVGMLIMQSGMAAQAILSPLEMETPFMGAIAENYVAQAFSANLIPLLYWKTTILPRWILCSKRNKISSFICGFLCPVTVGKVVSGQIFVIYSKNVRRAIVKISEEPVRKLRGFF